MSKIMEKIVSKKCLVLASAVIAVLVIASVIVSALCGVNYGVVTDDAKTITVSVNRFFYENDREAIESVCEAEFEKQGLDVEYTYYAEMSGDNCEIVYVFESDEAKVADAKTALEATVKTNVSENGDWYGFDVSVTSGSEVLPQKIAMSRVYRAAGAVALFAVLSFIYVAVRYRSVNVGIVAGVSPIVTALLAAAIVLLTRLPITNAAFYAVAVASLLASVFTLMTFNKLRSNLQSEEFESKSAEEAITASVACKQVLLTTAILGVSLVLVGAIATAATRWFAIIALVGVIAAAIVALVFVPALYLPFKKCADKKTEGVNVSGYVGAAKKSEENEEA